MKSVVTVIIMGLLLGCQQERGDHVVMDLAGFPTVFELNRGETYTWTREDTTGVERTWEIKLIDYQTARETNYWFPDSLPQANYFQARVLLSINGDALQLMRRPYQFPTTFGGLRLGVEAIKEWNTSAQLDNLQGMDKDVRLAVCLAEDSWGPDHFRFPIRDYVWRSSTYSNSWGALVPYNLVYYHHGEDLAAIPDRLDVQSLFSGKVAQTAYPDGDGASNSIVVRMANGFGYRVAHMNTEYFTGHCALGTRVDAGDLLGKTGETWDGRKSQTTGPHLHFEFLFDSTKLNSYPYAMEAYFREYPDKVLAVAGGYRFLEIGQSITLDGTRSLTRDLLRPASLTWITHKGDTITKPLGTVKYDRPGLYSETLIAATLDGHEDRDFLQVRVFDPKREGRNIVCRHAHYSPVRDLSIGDTITFWNRMVNNVTGVYIDYGDDTDPVVIKDESYHVYSEAGSYTVTLTTTGPEGEPASLQMEVKIGE